MNPHSFIHLFHTPPNPTEVEATVTKSTTSLISERGLSSAGTTSCNGWRIQILSLEIGVSDINKMIVEEVTVSIHERPYQVTEARAVISAVRQRLDTPATVTFAVRSRKRYGPSDWLCFQTPRYLERCTQTACQQAKPCGVRLPSARIPLQRGGESSGELRGRRS